MPEKYHVYKLKDVAKAWEEDVAYSETSSGPYETLVRIVDVKGPNGEVIRVGAPESFIGSLETIPQGYVYFIRRGNDGPIKIGRTTNVPQRIETLQTGSAEKLVLLGVIACARPEKLERQLQEIFERDRLEGEWFQASETLMFYIDLANNTEYIAK